MSWYRLPRLKKEYNKERLRKLKLASLKYKESMLNYQIKHGYDDKMISQTMREISHIKSELNNLQ